jgi:hypothetical protein
MKLIHKLFILGFCASLYSCGKKGCTDPSATNFDEDATKYDGTCEYAEIITEDSMNLYVKLNHNFGNQNLDFDSEYDLGNSTAVNLAVFKYYISNLSLKSSTNTVLSDIELIDLVDPNTTTIRYKAAPGNYDGLEFNIGVPEDLNSKDPSVYPVGHPLSSLNGTYWTWSTQYRFVMLEGKADTTGNGIFDLNYVYHTGIDTCFRSVDYPSSFTVPNYEDSVIVNVNFHFDEFWSGIDVKTEDLTHVTDEMELALKVSDAFANAFHP